MVQNILFFLFGSAVLAVIPPRLLPLAPCQPTDLWEGGVGCVLWVGQAALMFWKNCSAVAKTVVCYEHCFN